MNEAKTQPDTRERILDAAERLFMESGYEGTSMRMITGEAGVNLAAVNDAPYAQGETVYGASEDAAAGESARSDELQQARDEGLVGAGVVHGVVGVGLLGRVHHLGLQRALHGPHPNCLAGNELAPVRLDPRRAGP